MSRTRLSRALAFLALGAAAPAAAQFPPDAGRTITADVTGRPRITGIGWAGFPAHCPAPGSKISIEGLSLGVAPAGRSLFVGGPGKPGAPLAIHSWSNGVIVALAPPGPWENAIYTVSLRNADRTTASEHPFPSCAARTAVSGTLRSPDCAGADAYLRVRAGATDPPTALADPGAGGRLYRTTLGAAGLVLEPHLAPGAPACPGGAWVPQRRTLAYASPAPVEGQDFELRVRHTVTRVPLGTIASLVYTAFLGTRVHVNTYGAEHRVGTIRLPLATGGFQEIPVLSWFRADDCYITLGTLLGGERVPFLVPEIILEVPLLGSPRYYVNDFNSRSIRTEARGTRLALIVGFESAGTEIVGRGGGLSPAPDIQVDDGVLEILFHLYPDREGRPSYGRVNATFRARYDGACHVGTIDICGNLASEIGGPIGRAVERALENDALKSLFGARLAASLDSEGGRAAMRAATGADVGRILRMHWAPDGFLEVEHVPR